MNFLWLMNEFLKASWYFLFFFWITTLSWKCLCLLRSTPGWNWVRWPMTEINSRTKQLCVIFLNLSGLRWVSSEELEWMCEFWWKILGEDRLEMKGHVIGLNLTLAGFYFWVESDKEMERSPCRIADAQAFCSQVKQVSVNWMLHIQTWHNIKTCVGQKCF